MAAVGHCGVIDAYVEFDETHCVLQSVVQSFIDGSATWDEVLEGKMSKVYLGTATTTSTTPRPAAPRTQAGRSVWSLDSDSAHSILFIEQIWLLCHCSLILYRI